MKRYKLASPRQTAERQDAELYKMLIYATASEEIVGEGQRSGNLLNYIDQQAGIKGVS